MSLEGLLKIGQLRAHPANRGEIQKLLAAAARNLQQAGLAGASSETRFDCAYKAIQKCALAAMLAHGYRPNTSKPGHHMTVLQALPHTIRMENQRVALFDALRYKRNASDYSGDDVEESVAAECITTARTLFDEVTAWLKANRPELA